MTKLSKEDMMGRKPQYTQEFQDNAVRLVVADEMGYAVAAKQLGISSAKLRSWVHRWKRDSKLAHNTSQDSYVQELLDLRKENEELREANEILKKAAAYFAKGL
jgi:transposase